MGRLTIGKKLWLTTGVLFLIILITGMASYNSTRKLVEDIRRLGGTELPAVRSMTLADMMHDGIRAVIFHSIIVSASKNQEDMKEVVDEFDEFSKNIREHLEAISKLNIDESIKKRISEADDHVQAYISQGKIVLELAKNQKTNEAIQSMAPFEKSFSELEADLGALGEAIEKSAEDTVLLSEKDADFSITFNFVIVIVGLIFGLIVSAWTNRDLLKILSKIISQLSEQSTHLGGSASDINESAKNLLITATEQAAAVQETASSIEEINSMVKKTSENSVRLSATVEESNASTKNGQSSVSEMLNSMRSINESNVDMGRQIEESNSKIMEIVKVISEIGEKTKVINDIVFQTKLLSFNASVEAARAGEHGKGFAVVAEEVGNLAQMSGNAAKEISVMLDSGIQRANGIIEESSSRLGRLMSETKNRIDQGTTVSEKCGTSLNEIVSQVNDVSTMTTEISEAIREQSQGIGEITKTIHLFDKASQAGSTAAENASKISRNLVSQFETIRAVVGFLDQMVNGNQSQIHSSTNGQDVQQTETEQRTEETSTQRKAA